MEVYGGGIKVTRDKINAGDWIYVVNYKCDATISKIIKDEDGNLLSLNLDLNNKEEPSLYDLNSSNDSYVKLGNEPILQLYPHSIKSGVGFPKTGFICLDKDGTARMAIVNKRLHGRALISWVQLSGLIVEPRAYKSDSDVYYTNWELIIPSFDPSKPVHTCNTNFSHEVENAQ